MLIVRIRSADRAIRLAARRCHSRGVARVPACLGIAYLFGLGLLEDVGALALGLRLTVSFVGSAKVADYRAAALSLLENLWA
ncbi:MAG: hypothetical protein JWM77_125 [Rhodospirillales bacterium]|nr:hypothetical protein [Rhodospirillales bacterium]